MKRKPGMSGARICVWGLTALLLAAFNYGLSPHPASAQDRTAEHDASPAADVEPGDGPPAEADTPEVETEAAGKTPPGQSGLKVPRFASLRSGEVNVRTGPGTRYPVEWKFQRRGLPVEITAEFGTWRRVRDGQGAEGWVHRSMLSGKRTALIATGVATLRRRSSADSAPVAQAQQGVVATVRSCSDKWCEIDTQGFRGWVPQTALWGVYPTETIK